MRSKFLGFVAGFLLSSTVLALAQIGGGGGGVGGGGGGGGTPANPTTSIQFNNSGSFGGSAYLLWSDTDRLLSLDGTASPQTSLTEGLLLSKSFAPAADTATAIAIIDSEIVLGGSHNYSGGQQAIYGFLQTNGTATTTGTGDSSISGGYLELDVEGGNVAQAVNLWLKASVNSGTTTLLQGLGIPTPAHGSTITTYEGIWVGAVGGAATNSYSFWSDETGVFRIRSDNTFNSVYQAIPALYNPQVTKYTPGAADYERIVFQWESNVGVLTTEKGGTGTLRNLKLGDTGVHLILEGVTSTGATGTGKFVFDGTPTLVTPVLGVATATSINKVAFTAPASSATLTIADGKTLTDTSGVGAVLLKGATGGGFAAAVAADIPATTLATGTSVSLTAPKQYYVCTGTCTVTPPVPAAGYEFCVINDDNVATVITMAALGSSARYEVTARTSYGTASTGTMVSGGAVGDKVCLVGLDSTHYLTTSYNGVWTVN